MLRPAILGPRPQSPGQLGRFEGHKVGRAKLPELNGWNSAGKRIYCEDERLSLRWPGTVYGYFDLSEDNVMTLTEGDMDYILEVCSAWFDLPETFKGQSPSVRAWFCNRPDPSGKGYRDVPEISRQLRGLIVSTERASPPGEKSATCPAKPGGGTG